MMRQPFTTKTIAFKPNIIDAKDSVIKAVDYDLGRNGFAYSDADTGNYYISGGNQHVGNKGGLYRNDGVDIYKDSGQYESYYVGSIEDSEWIKYTIDVKEKSSYNLKLLIAAEDNSGNITVSVDDKNVFDNISIASTNNLKNWQTQTLGKLNLNKGTHTIKLYFNKGGFDFKLLVFTN